MLRLSLPVELTDAIIDYLHADHIALTACSLVCHAWRGAAQHHLLPTIYCVGDELEQLLTQIEAQDGSSRVKDDRSYIENSGSQFVDGEGVSGVTDEKGISASFVAHVREVYVYETRPDHLIPFSIGTMARVLAALPNLHTLHLEDVSFKSSDTAQAHDVQGAKGLETRRRHRLRRLDLVMVRLTDTQQLSAMLGICAEARDLALERVFCSHNHDAEVEGERTLCESLVIDGEFPVSFEVRRMLRVDALKTCEVEFPRPTCVPKVLEMLGAAAGSLESLALHLFSTDNIPPWKPLDAIPWTKLRHLSLVFKDRNLEPTTLVPIALLLSYLPQTIRAIKLALDVPFGGLRSEHFGVSCPIEWPLWTVGWVGLETQLMRFTRMGSLIIRLYPDEPHREVLDEARKMMPKLVARGLLSEY